MARAGAPACRAHAGSGGHVLFVRSFPITDAPDRPALHFFLIFAIMFPK